MWLYHFIFSVKLECICLAYVTNNKDMWANYDSHSCKLDVNDIPVCITFLLKKMYHTTNFCNIWNAIYIASICFDLSESNIFLSYISQLEYLYKFMPQT